MADASPAINESTSSPAPSQQQAEEHAPKFVKGQRVFAKDEASGILYEAVVRRTMYGIARQRQKYIHDPDSDDEEEEGPEWHFFVHYLGWNVKWDRWIAQTSLYEISDKTRELAQKLHQAVKDTKKKYGKQGPQFISELSKRMKRLEQERRLEERREELAKQGIIMDDSEELAAAAKPRNLTKAAFQKELKQREERQLQARRKQAHAEKLALPFSLKKVSVEEWEMITQCSLVPTLPATVTIEQVLHQYRDSKVKGSNEDETVSASTAHTAADGDKESNSAAPKDAPETPSKVPDSGAGTGGDNEVFAQVPSTSATAADAPDQATPKASENDSKKEAQEWQDMVDGIALLFDQAVGSRLLYRQEQSQHESIQLHPEYGKRRSCQVYGCEHLLRLFIRLPALLADELTDAQSRPIFSKINDFMRFLQKHQSKVFSQSYHAVPPPPAEQSRKRPPESTVKRRVPKKSRKAPPPNKESSVAEGGNDSKPAEEKNKATVTEGKTKEREGAESTAAVAAAPGPSPEKEQDVPVAKDPPPKEKSDAASLQGVVAETSKVDSVPAV